MEWDDVRHVLALARAGSVRAAGKSLGVSHSTVARRVEALEGHLGTRLFDRSADGWALTAAGREMVVAAERVELTFSEMERGLVGQDGRIAGAVAITCGDNHMARLLLDALAPLCRAHPELELRVTVDGRPFDLARREADVAIRVLPPDTTPPEYLLGARVAPVFVASYVAIAHADRLDPALPEARPRWLGFEDPRLLERLIGTSSFPDVPAWGSFGTLEAIQGAARAGLGLVMLPIYVGDSDPLLRRLEPPDLRHLADVWLLCHPDLRHTARVQAVRAAVAEMFRVNAGVFQA